MHDTDIDEILTYFETKTGGTRLPKRSEVSPSQLKKWLPDICILAPHYTENGRINDVTVTLIGTAVASFYGEITNTRISDHPSSDAGTRIINTSQLAIDERKPIFARAQSVGPNKNVLILDGLYIPLSKDGEHIDRLFLYIRIRSQSASGIAALSAATS